MRNSGQLHHSGGGRNGPAPSADSRYVQYMVSKFRSVQSARLAMSHPWSPRSRQRSAPSVRVRSSTSLAAVQRAEE